jgi:hypothetical protein
MQRDWELIRKILLAVEANPPGQTVGMSAISGVDPGIVGSHISMLKDAGFLKAAILPGFGGAIRGAEISELTFAGHDLLDTIKSHGVWEKVKTTAKEKGVELSFEAVKTLAALALKQIIGAS